MSSSIDSLFRRSDLVTRHNRPRYRPYMRSLSDEEESLSGDGSDHSSQHELVLILLTRCSATELMSIFIGVSTAPRRACPTKTMTTMPFPMRRISCGLNETGFLFSFAPGFSFYLLYCYLDAETACLPHLICSVFRGLRIRPLPYPFELRGA